MTNSNTQSVDVLIIGGGIAGLWTLNILKQRGYNAILVESGILGGGQTGHCQGIIHGGIKYTLTGKLTQSAMTIADMPQLWKNCLQGSGDIDLRQAQCLSEHYYLWSTNKLTGRIGNFLLKKVLRSHAETIPKNEQPVLFQDPRFKGQVLRVSECVLDVPSLIHALADNVKGSIYKVAAKDGVRINSDGQSIQQITLCNDAKNQQTMSAKRYLFCAGESNQALLKGLAQAPAIQTRPLHMTLLKAPCDAPLYAHCLGKSSTPRLTITSHYDNNGALFWYIGGEVAESGVARSQDEQQQFVLTELSQLFPWLNFQSPEIDSFYINRAEVEQPDHSRPDNYFHQQQNNWHVAWPTKLALAPLLANDMVKSITNDIAPMQSKATHLDNWPEPTRFNEIWKKPC